MKAHRIAALGLCAITVGALLTAPVAAQRPAPDKDKQTETGKPRRPAGSRRDANGRRPGAGVTAEQAAAAHTLVQEHHPELDALLTRLKKARPAQYSQAVRSLFRTSVRLAAIQERDMERYQLELKRWKLESQSQLLALRVVRSKHDPELRAELQEVARDLIETRVALLKLDRDRQQARLQRLNDELNQLTQAADGRVEASVNNLIRSAKSLVKSEQKRPGRRQPERTPAPNDK